MALVVTVMPDGTLTSGTVKDRSSDPGLALSTAAARGQAAGDVRVDVTIRNASRQVAYNPSIEILPWDSRRGRVRSSSTPRCALMVAGSLGLLPGAEGRVLVALPTPPAGMTTSWLLRPEAAPRVVRVIGRYGSDAGAFSKPRGVHAMPNGDLVVADRGNNRIHVLRPDGTSVTSWGGYGTAPGLFDHPEDAAVDARSGEIYICDMNNARVQVFSRPGVLARVLTGGRAGGFNHPGDIALSPDGRTLYVADTGNMRIVRLGRDGQWLGEFGSFGTKGGQFRAILDVETGSDGRVYVTDGANQELQVFTAIGAFIQRVNAGIIPRAKLRHPTAVVPFGDDRVLVADFGDDRIMALSLRGEFLGEFGRQSDAPGGLHYPSDMRLVGSALFVSETASNTVTVFDLAGWAPFAEASSSRARPARPAHRSH